VRCRRWASIHPIQACRPYRSPLRALRGSCRLKRLRSPSITTVSAGEETQDLPQRLIRETLFLALFPLQKKRHIKMSSEDVFEGAIGECENRRLDTVGIRIDLASVCVPFIQVSTWVPPTRKFTCISLRKGFSCFIPQMCRSVAERPCRDHRQRPG
jgi:hypothetical protein